MNRRIICGLLVILVLFSFFGCVGKDTDVPDQNSQTENNTDKQDKYESSGEAVMKEIIIEVNDRELKVALENNSSSEALAEKLKDQNIVVYAHDYGSFEKVGDLGFSLPRNDRQITTKPGDLILYQGNQLTLYYDTNSWSFTKLGEVTNINRDELRNILGSGDVTLTLKKAD